jgi:hypothetical protein
MSRYRTIGVNSAEVHEPAPGQIRIQLEMQSGDQILIVAEQFDLTPPKPRGTPTDALR